MKISIENQNPEESAREKEFGKSFPFYLPSLSRDIHVPKWVFKKLKKGAGTEKRKLAKDGNMVYTFIKAHKPSCYHTWLILKYDMTSHCHHQQKP